MSGKSGRATLRRPMTGGAGDGDRDRGEVVDGNVFAGRKWPQNRFIRRRT